MTKEEFAKEMLRIGKEMRDLERLGRETTSAYIAEHREYGDGDKVKLTYEDWRGIRGEGIFYIARCRTHDKGELYYVFLKTKKDGSPSSHRLRNYDKMVSIELIEKAKPTNQ